MPWDMDAATRSQELIEDDTRDDDGPCYDISSMVSDVMRGMVAA